VGIKRLNIELPEKVWRELKKASVDEDKPMAKIVLGLIEEWLQKLKGTTKK